MFLSTRTYDMFLLAFEKESCMNLLSESRKKKKKNWEDEDFYDSDDDTFLDRTGDIEKKRRQRKRRLGVEVEKAQSYQTLVCAKLSNTCIFCQQ